MKGVTYFRWPRFSINEGRFPHIFGSLWKPLGFRIALQPWLRFHFFIWPHWPFIQVGG